MSYLKIIPKELYDKLVIYEYSPLYQILLGVLGDITDCNFYKLSQIKDWCNRYNKLFLALDIKIWANYKTESMGKAELFYQEGRSEIHFELSEYDQITIEKLASFINWYFRNFLNEDKLFEFICNINSNFYMYRLPYRVLEGTYRGGPALIWEKSETSTLALNGLEIINFPV